MLQARGYSVENYDALQTGYHNKPTPFQIASYDAYVVGLIKKGDLKTFSSLLQAGLSSNPCNVFGDSILHTICRMSQHPKALQLMITNGADLHISDDYGKTILHDACWAATPNFSLVTLLLDHDPYLLHMRDARGALPLSYIQDRHVEAWLEFLQENKDRFWPENTKAKPPKYALQPPNQRPVPDPGLSLQMVRMLAAGKMSPLEVEFLLAGAESDSYCSSDESSDEEDGDEEEDDDEDASEEEDNDASSYYEDDSTLCSDECEGLPEKKKDLGFDSPPPGDGLESDEDSVVEGFEDELSKDSDMEGVLGILCPRYASEQISTPFVPPPIVAPSFAEPKVPEMLEIITSSDTSASQETDVFDSPMSLTAKKVPVIEPEMTPEAKKTPAAIKATAPGAGMARESVLL